MNQFRSGGFQMLPPVVKNLLIINGLLFLATQVLYSSGINLNAMLGLHWMGSEAYHWYQPITYMFMHADLRHIFFNMFAVWMFGNAIENRWGSKRFLTYYIICGLGAAALHYGIAYFETIQGFNTLIDAFLANPNTETFATFNKAYPFQINPDTGFKYTYDEAYPYLDHLFNGSTDRTDIEMSYEFMAKYKEYFLSLMNVVGASGSLFGILLAFGMMFPNAELYMMFIPIPIKAKYFVAGYGAFELFSGLSGSNDGIAHFAHLGGLISGYILIRIWQKYDSSFRLV